MLGCYRYIELNPVDAGIVKHPARYTWSSYCANALGKEDRLVSPHAAFLALGLDSMTRLRAATRGGYPMGSDPSRKSGV